MTKKNVSVLAEAQLLQARSGLFLTVGIKDLCTYETAYRGPEDAEKEPVRVPEFQFAACASWRHLSAVIEAAPHYCSGK